jgi:MFS-type transporter involved in bile tolerance (Atg22 family)
VYFASESAQAAGYVGAVVQVTLVSIVAYASVNPIVVMASIMKSLNEFIGLNEVVPAVSVLAALTKLPLVVSLARNRTAN